MAASLFLHGKIVTTLAKAKDCRPFAEHLITRARKGTLHDRRIVASKLQNSRAVKKLFDEIADRFRNRSGGYTSIHRLSKNRLGDNAPTAIIELVTWEPGSKPKAKRRKKPPTKPKAKTQAAGKKPDTKPPPPEPGKEKPAQAKAGGEEGSAAQEKGK